MGRGKAARSLKLIAARTILAEVYPAGLHPVCYWFFASGLVRSMSKLETDKMSRQLTDAPERGWIYE